MDELQLATFPLAMVDRHMRSHKLQYINRQPYAFDYASANAKIIPICIDSWAREGIDVSHEFVEHIWSAYATKRDGNRDGELLRIQKLVLDALRHLRDMAAFTELCGIQCLYRESEDMAGRDLLLWLPKVGPTWVQLQVNISGRFLDTKKRRREERRVNGRRVWELSATEADCICDRKPYVPAYWWYGQATDNLIATILQGQRESA